MNLHSTDHTILQTAINWLRKGHQVALVTVVKTWGSAPRPCGSLLIMRDDGIHAGSVSGGCVEEDLVARYKDNELSDHFPSTINYGTNREEALRFGLPCGGRLELVVEALITPAPLQALLDHIAAGHTITRRLCLTSGEVSLHKPDTTSTAIKAFSYTEQHVAKVFGPTWHMLLIGAGHLSQYVANIALMFDYKVTVCDPRKEYQQSWHIDGVTLIPDMPDDAVRSLGSHSRSIVLTLTHDPKLDDMALMEALQHNIFFVGALGSLRSSKKRHERLQTLGISQHQLSQLHAPVGLDIGSRTPPEIAVSIIAEITAARNKPASNSPV